MDRRKGPQPNKWKYKDPIKHDQNKAYQVHKAQANFRKEEHNLSFEDYCKLWNSFIPFTQISYWSKKGRTKGSYCLTRKDKTKPWSYENCEFIQRHKTGGRPKKEIIEGIDKQTVDAINGIVRI